MASKIPARIDLTIEGEQFASGATVSFNVTVTAQDRLNRSDLIAELVAVEEVDPYPTGDEDYEDEYEEDEEAGDEGVEGNLVSVSFNGGNGEDDAEDEDTEDMDDEEDWVQSTTYSEEVVLAEGLALKAGESRSFSGSFVVPEDAQPTYDGVNATHTWWIDIYLEGDVEINQSKEFYVR